MANFLYGSICITEAIEAGQIKKVRCKDGKERIYLNIQVVEKKQPQEFDGRKYTHFVSCAPKKERKEGINYIIGDLQTYSENPQPATPSAEDIAQAPPVDINDLQF